MSAALSPFAEMVARSDARIELARACLFIAEDVYPGLDIERYMADIDRLAIDLRASLPDDSGAEKRVVALNRLLFDELGYTGNTRDYYDPRNSYLNEVMERRTGIPITLSILYMEVGRRIGLPLEGVSFPGHFLVRLKLRGGTLMLDPFAGGEPQSEDDLRGRLERVIPREVADPIPVAELPLEQFLDPASNRQILARVLRNLKGIYRDKDQPERMLQVLNRILVLSPDASAELRDRGFVYQRLEAFRAALQDLSVYLEREPDAPDAEEVRETVLDLSAVCAKLN